MSPHELAVISDQLSPRDRQALRTVSRFRVMSGRQLGELLWDEVSPNARARVARRGLSRLARLGVLQPLARRVGGERSGSASTTYAVGRAGQYLLQSGATSKRRVRAAHTPGARYLAHTLAVAQLYVDLVGAERQEQAELIRFEPEPQRPYMAGFGARQVLKPDAFLKLGIADYEFSWFIEQDMATESLSTVKGKALRYHEYFRTGTEQAARGVFPRVLWIAPDTARAEDIRETLAQLPAAAHRLFVVATTAEAVALLTSEARS
ncbi:MAG TPA: replication-relaxation family protein [Solirubrobacteraceae bacterium]|nr:replication-relaxation family protein [Solirubrobacteraceae bacterium]